MATPGTAVGGADQGSAEGEAAEPKSRRAPAPLNIEDNDAPFWPAPTSRLSGEMWDVAIHRHGAEEEPDYVEFECDRSYISYSNVILLKSKMGYSAQDYLYYMKRTSNNTATLISVDYEHKIEPMLAACARERKLRLVLSVEQPTQLNSSITPLKRPRAKTQATHEDVPAGEEAIDAYKEWLSNLEQDQLDPEFRDDYRVDTVKTYKEWLRRKGFLTEILAYVQDDESDGHIDSDDEREDRPSHARRNKKTMKGSSSEGSQKNGRGALKGFSATMKRIKNGSQKLKIEFASKLGGPTGPNTRTFVDEVVLFMRKRAPLIGVKKWSDIGQNVKNSIASDIMDRWDLQDTANAKEKIWAVAKERYKGWRATYSATYKAYSNYAKRLKNMPEDLDLVEWHYLIMYFGTNDFQKLSKSNSSNCGERRINHCVGSQPFSKISYEQRDPETGVEPSDIDLWMNTHSTNGRWSNEAAKAVYDDVVMKVQEKCVESDRFALPNLEQNIIFQSTYKQSTGCKTSTTYGHGYMCTRPTEKESMQDQIERQASATLAANRKNKELEDEIVKLKEKLVNQEAESDRKLEEKMQRFKEEESLKLQAFKDELMAAVQGGRQTPSAQLLPTQSSPKNPANQEEHVHKTAANSSLSNANQTTAAQTGPNIPDIIAGEDTPSVDKSAANSPVSDATETQVVQTARKRLDPTESTPARAKKNSQVAGVHQNKSYATRQQLVFNAAIKRVRTRSQQDS